MADDSPGGRLLAEFIDHLAAERRLSPHTCAAYRRDIEMLLNEAAAEPAALRPADLRRCLSALHGRGLGGRSLARRLSAWRSFFRYLVERHGLDANPCVGLRPPKAPKALPLALSPDQAVRLVDFDGTDPLVRRDRAVFELAYSSGLRVSELATLGVGDVDLDDATVIVTGKGQKTRIVPVGSFALAAIRAWLPSREALARPEEMALFVNRFGTALTPRALQYRLTTWALRQGIGSRVHPHMLRHSFASHLLQSSGDLRAVQEMLGHASVGTTQVYTHLDFQYLAKIYDSAHPRARKKG